MIDVGTAQHAIATATQYPQKLHAAAVAAQGVVLGPWQLSVKCTYGASDKNWVGYDVNVDFANTRADLQRTLSEAQSSASTFLGSFNFLRTWLATTVPATTAQFQAADAAVQKAIAAAKNNQLTQAERAAVAQTLSTLVATLDGSKTTLETGNQQLAALATAMQNYGSNTAAIVQRLTSQGTAALQNMQVEINSQPCGVDDGNRQLAGFLLQFTNASNRFSAIFASMAGDTKQAADAVSQLTGIVVNLASMYRPAITKVEQAQASEVASFLQGFQLKVATGNWESLESYANQQLGSARASLAVSLSAMAPAQLAAEMVGSATRSAEAEVTQVIDLIFGGH